MSTNVKTGSVFSFRERVRAFEENCAKDPECALSEQMFNLLFKVTADTAAALEHTFDDLAVAHLHNHYQKQFYYGLKVKGLQFDEQQKAALLVNAVQLGVAAVKRAKARVDPPPNNVIMRPDVNLATLDVDCVPIVPSEPHATLKIFFEWCN